MTAGELQVTAEHAELARAYIRGCEAIAATFPRDKVAQGANQAVVTLLRALGIEELIESSEPVSDELSASNGG